MPSYSVDTGRSLHNNISAVPTEEKQAISQAEIRYWSSRKCVASAHFQTNVWRHWTNENPYTHRTDHSHCLLGGRNQMSGKHYTWMQERIFIVGECRLLHSGCSRASNTRTPDVWSIEPSDNQLSAGKWASLVLLPHFPADSWLSLGSMLHTSGVLVLLALEQRADGARCANCGRACHYYYSKFPSYIRSMDKWRTTVIKTIKCVFAEEGHPERVISDNYG